MATKKRTCSIDGCDNPAHARGWCGKHYKRWQAHGDPNYVRPSAPAVCGLVECGDAVFANALCGAHYKRLRKHGDPELGGPRQYSSPEEAFRARTRSNGDCIEWTGATVGHGYGYMAAGGRMVYAHRFAWERERGAIPEGMQVNHKCWNVLCVRIAHLELVSREQNNWYRSGPNAVSSSGVRGVISEGNKWVVKFKKRGKLHRFGVYSSVEEAAVVAEEARRELFGDYAGRG